MTVYTTILNGITYTYDTADSGGCILTTGTNVATVVIPNDVSFNNSTITANETIIGASAFYNKTSLFNITLSSNLVDICNNAFNVL